MVLHQPICDVPTHRMEKLNFALNLLEQLNVPVVVGNLPDVRNAIGKMLSNNQVPSKESLDELNKRIHSWGNEHDNVSIIDVFTLWNKVLHDEEIVLLEHTWPAGSREKLLQKDMLHTTFEGTVAASLLVAEATKIDCVETDPKSYYGKSSSKCEGICELTLRLLKHAWFNINRFYNRQFLTTGGIEFT